MRYFTHVNTTLFAMDAAINWAAALLARLVRYFALYFFNCSAIVKIVTCDDMIQNLFSLGKGCRKSKISRGEKMFIVQRK